MWGGSGRREVDTMNQLRRKTGGLGRVLRGFRAREFPSEVLVKNRGTWSVDSGDTHSKQGSL